GLRGERLDRSHGRDRRQGSFADYRSLPSLRHDHAAAGGPPEGCRDSACGSAAQSRECGGLCRRDRGRRDSARRYRHAWVIGGEAGVRPYVFVERVDETLEKVVAHGGAVVTAPYPEGDLWVATFHDPPGNVIGVWQQGSGDMAE